MDLFFKAAKEKWRFTTPKGVLSVEDLFDLPLVSKNENTVSLNSIAVGLYKQSKNDDAVSFVRSSRSDSENAANVRLELVKAVIAHREAEIDARARDAEHHRKIQELKEILADKESSELRGKSAEEIRAMLESMLTREQVA